MGIKIHETIKNLILVKVSISQWNGKVKAKEIAREVERNKNADSGSVGAFVQTLPKSIASKLSTVSSRIRMTTYRLSLPFEDGGWRVLPASCYTDFVDEISKLKQSFDDVVEDEIIGKYDEWFATAPARLGEVYYDGIIPTYAYLREAYGIESKTRLISTGDARVEGITDGVMDTLRENINNSLCESLQGAVNEIGSRLKEMVTKMQENIASDKQSGKHYNSFAKQVEKTCESLTRLNVTGDPRIDETIAKVQDGLTEHDSDMLRDEEIIRNEQKETCSELVDELNDIFA